MTHFLIKGGEVHAAPGTDSIVADILLKDGIIARIGNLETPTNATVIDAKNSIVAPALIDIHTHIYWGATALGVRPEVAAARSGTGTFVDAGSAGAANVLGFREFIHKQTPFNTLAYLNISFPGIYGFSPNVMVGEAENLALLDVETCVQAAKEYSDIVVGIKVRAGRLAAGDNGAEALARGLRAAEQSKLPLMCHIDLDPPHIVDILNNLRPGDVLTHCCRPEPNAPVENGQIRDVAWMAKERGVLFDIGHGMGGFSFETCRNMLRDGFVPDLISSDIHCMSIDGPAFDALTTLNKLLALGVGLKNALAAATSNAAKVIGRPDLGRIQVGDAVNLAVFTRDGGTFPLVDATGEVIRFKDSLSCSHLFAKGELHKPDTTEIAKLNSERSF